MTAYNKHIKAQNAFEKASQDRKNWQDFDKCCLNVSLFNRYQQDHYLLSTIEWINKRFDNCTINLGDTLHRHNLEPQYNSMETAHQAAHQLGDEWIAKNGPLLENLTIPYEIVRNDTWLEHDDFQDVHDTLWDLYWRNSDFRAAVTKDVETFVSRQKDKDPETIRKSSRCYLLEELAADILLCKDKETAHLYPGSRFDCYWYIADNPETIPPILRGLENSAFKRLSPARMMRSYKGPRTHQLTSGNKEKSINLGM